MGFKNNVKVFLVSLSTSIVIMFFGCAGSTQESYDSGSYKKIFTSDPDKVWTAAVGYFTQKNIPIKMIEKSSGMMVTEYWHDPKWTDEDIVGAECHEPDGLPEYKTLTVSVQFSIFVKQLGDSQTSVQVNTEFRGVLKYQSTFGEPIEKEISCSSNGKLEAKVLEGIAGKL